MTPDATDALRELRDTLRIDIPDVDSFAFALSSALHTIDLHPTSAPGGSSRSSGGTSEAIRAVEKYLLAIQVLLLTRSVPTFLHALSSAQKDLLDRFFVPPKEASSTSLSLGRSIALVSYQTLPALLNASAISPLPVQSRQYILDVLDRLARTYSIDDLYWCVWSNASGTGIEDEKERNLRKLKWEEAVKSLMSVPAKVANAVGQWKADKWDSNLPDSLTPRSVCLGRLRTCLVADRVRTFFDIVSVKLEALMYEMSQAASEGTRIPALPQRSSADAFSCYEEYAAGTAAYRISRNGHYTPSGKILPGGILLLRLVTGVTWPPTSAAYLAPSTIFARLPAISSFAATEQ